MSKKFMYKSLVNGLKEALADAKGEKTLKRNVIGDYEYSTHNHKNYVKEKDNDSKNEE